MRLRRWSVLALSLTLAGCGATRPVPDFTYFRLPPPARPQHAGALLFPGPVVVDSFAADGLYADQALIHALDPGAQQLRQYHYQLWTDPPTRILQRRLIAQLRAAHVAPRITDELPASEAALRIRGIILRFDRVPDAHGGYRAVVALKLRVDRTDHAPLIDDYYSAGKAAAGPGLKSTVDAFGAAIDEIFATFESDLRQHAADADAR